MSQSNSRGRRLGAGKRLLVSLPWLVALLIVVLASYGLSSCLGKRKNPFHLLVDTYQHICGLVEANFYSDSPQLHEWARQCQKNAGALEGVWDWSQFRREMDAELAKLSASHLDLWDPISNKLMWLNQSVDTGLRARLIDEHWIVARIVEKSAAENSGVLIGDEIVSIADHKIFNSWDVHSQKGRFVFLRGSKEYFVDMVPFEVSTYEGPELFDLGSNKGVLKFSSFVASYFDNSDWLPLAKKLEEFNSLIVDLRGNAGGDVVAMLRAMSPFFCNQEVIGYLHQPRKKEKKEGRMPNDLTFDAQKAIFEGLSQVDLRTFEDYPCFRKEVTVLVDEETSSTAEIFAEAMKQRPHTRVWGRRSSGSVLIGFWFPLPLGTGYSLSVPIAAFETTDHINLEGDGVYPQNVLEYDLDMARQGSDSWIVEAAETPWR